MPPLTALRAFEAAARHLSLTRAAAELHVTAGALSHQIRGLEDMLGVKLFERRVRAIALTAAGKELYPGLQTGFIHIRDALASLDRRSNERVLVVSTPPGFTAKWLAPRLYRFANAHPEIDARISSSLNNADFTNDGVDVAVRNMHSDSKGDQSLRAEKLVDLSFVAVCSPRLIERHGPLNKAEALARVPLIHDDTLVNRIRVPTWADWFRTAGVDNVDLSRGLRFNSADHALDAATEGAGVLLSHDLLAYDDLRSGRLVIPVKLSLSSGRAYHLVSPKSRGRQPHVEAFRAWIVEELATVDWRRLPAAKGMLRR
jgi:LysR family glycine cleavage system transcriptional activator